MDIFTSGMKNQWSRRVYIDLFAGPGRCVVEGTSREFPGSPVLALLTKTPFTHLYLNDLDSKAVAALQRRSSTSNNVELYLETLDCNDAARDAAEKLSLDMPGTLGLAVIDPTAFQISLEAIEAMTRGRRVDLIITVMTDFLRRFIDNPSFEGRFDAFFGSRDWRQFVDARAAGETITYRALLDHYESSLKSIGYKHVDDHVRILNSKDRPLYHLVFASKHPKGAEFFKKIRQKRFDGQGMLL